jgi:hypothetical protein
LLGGIIASNSINHLKMLAYLLSVLVGTGSVGIYLAAFVFPEIYRKHDFIWSGLGLFYALVLWVEANQLSGGLLLGQLASVLLLGWFGWQTISLRRQLTPVNQRTPWPEKLELGIQSSFTNASNSAAIVDSSLSGQDDVDNEDTPAAWIEIQQEFPAAHQDTSD